MSIPASVPRATLSAPARAARLLLCGVAGGLPLAAIAQAPITFAVAPGALDGALNDFARQAGIMLSFDPALVGGKRSAGLAGRFNVADGFVELLAPHGLAATRAGSGTWTLRALPSEAPTVVTITGERERADAGLRAQNQQSATKMALPLRETPQAITVVTSDSIKLRQARDLTSALELTAGLVPSSESTIGGPFAGRGLEAAEGFSLRGQTLKPGRDIKVDGFGMPASQFDLALFERVEVVKGPSSVLYGQGSVGGFINYVRKKPQAQSQASVVVQAGSWDTYRAEADITGALDAAGDVAGRMIAVYDDAGSFIDGVWTRSSVLAPSVAWRLGERTKLLAEVLVQDDRFVPSHGIPLFVDGDTLRIPDIPRSRFVGAPAQDDSLSKNVAADMRLDHQFDDRWLATLVLQRSQQKFERYFDNYGHGGLGPIEGTLYDRPPRSNTGDTWLYADTFRSTEDAWGGELRIDGRFHAAGREHRVLFGVDGNKREFRGAFGYQWVGIGNIYSGEFPTDGTHARDIPVGEWESSSHNLGAYGQVLLNLGERTRLLAGMRHDRAKQSIGYGAETNRANTFRIGASHDVLPNATAYANWGQSFSPVEDSRQWNGTETGALMAPERGVGYELGLKTDWFDRKLSASVALYQNELKNVPVPDPDPAHRDFSVSSGLQRASGVEFEVAGSPMRGVQLSAALSFARSKYVDPSSPDYGLTPYGFVPRNASVYASYEWQEGPLRGFGAGLTYSYVGQRSFAYRGLNEWVDNATTDQLYFDGYDRTDLNFYYNAVPNWSFSLQVRNVFDQIYIEHMRDVESNNYFGSPRALLLRAEYRF